MKKGKERADCTLEVNMTDKDWGTLHRLGNDQSEGRRGVINDKTVQSPWNTDQQSKVSSQREKPNSSHVFILLSLL